MSDYGTPDVPVTLPPVVQPPAAPVLDRTVDVQPATPPATPAAPVDEQQPVTTPAAPVDEQPAAAPADTGTVVFYDVPGEDGAPVTHAGLVIFSAGGRLRVKDLGPAVESADFPAGDVRTGD